MKAKIKIFFFRQTKIERINFQPTWAARNVKELFRQNEYDSRQTFGSKKKCFLRMINKG